jgi:AcrR family transcriptional regulator
MTVDKKLRGDELKTAMIDAADRIIAEEGLKALTARRVAGDVGVAVGTTYNVFENLFALVAEVNTRTLAMLADEIAGIALDGRSAREVLMAFADCYMQFVRDHRNRWLAVFEVDMPDMQAAVPNQAFIDRLFGFLEQAIARHNSAVSEEAVRMSARGLWAAMHGLLMLSESNRLKVVGLPTIRPTIEHLVACHLAGLDAGANGHS